METKAPVDPQRTCPMVEVVFPEEDGSFPSFAEPGKVDKTSFAPNFWLISCPGCGYVSGMRCGNPKPEKTPSWLVVNDQTLYPSINCVGCCAWHGYLTDGVFRPC
jgi:hypothetical protein